MKPNKKHKKSIKKKKKAKLGIYNLRENVGLNKCGTKKPNVLGKLGLLDIYIYIYKFLFYEKMMLFTVGINEVMA